MSGPTVELKLAFRTGFRENMAAGFAKAQYAFSQYAADLIDPYVPFATGTLKNSVNQASKYEEGLLVYNTPYARKQYYLHAEGTDLRGDTGLRGSYWGQRAIAAHKDELERFARNAVQENLGGGT